MPLAVTHLRTGRTDKMAAARVLVGAVEHAELRTPDGPYLAAVLVHHLSGWVAHPLSDREHVVLDGAVLRPGDRGRVRRGSVLAAGGEEFRLDPTDPGGPADPAPPPVLQLEIRGPDGVFESRAADHDLLVGRLAGCDVYAPDTRLSRLAALLAHDSGGWFAVVLSRGPIAVNKHAHDQVVALADGDLVQIGPLFLTVGVRPPEAPAEAEPAHEPEPEPEPEPDPPPAVPTQTDTTEPTDVSDPAGLRPVGAKLDLWLRDRPAAPASGVFGRVRDKITTAGAVTAARVHRSNRRFREALAELEPAVRAHPDSEDLLRELERLYADAGLPDLRYRPLRAIEKAREAAGGAADERLLRDLAAACRDIGPHTPAMYDRALAYWQKVTDRFGVSTTAEQNDTMARQAISRGRYAGGRA